MRTLDDTSPLNGGDIDVAARIGWIIRMARTTTSGAGDTRLQAMAQRLGSSAAHLSRVETGQRRDSSLTHRYEQALGLPEGSIWSPIACLCRTFPRQSPRDSNPLTAEAEVHTFSELTDRLLDPNAPATGSDWGRWARSLSIEGNIGLPVSLFHQITMRLVSELARSVSHAYPARYEALALLRCSRYGSFVLDVARATFATDGSRGRTILASAVGEAVSPDAVKWAMGLLEDPSTAFHGSLALESMGQTCLEGFWDELTAPIMALFTSTVPGSEHEWWVTHVIRLMPRDVWRSSGLTPSRPLPATRGVTDWERSDDNELWAWCVRQADEIAASIGVAPQPMLARLLFEIAFGPWENRALTSYMLLSALPAIASSIPSRMAAFAEENPDNATRTQVVRRVAEILHGIPLDGAARWVAHEDIGLRHAGLTVAGAAGTILDTGLLLEALRDPTTAHRARYAAGMASHPILRDAHALANLDEETQVELGWWRVHGGRVTL